MQIKVKKKGLIRSIGPYYKAGVAPFSALINFRGASGYVTDGAGQTYCLATDIYPTVRGGLTFGWESGSSISSADRDSGVDPRLAGINFQNDATASVFRLDLPAVGSYLCDMAAGDATFAQPGVQEQLIIDTASTLKTVSDPGTTDGHFIDINATDFSNAAAWASGHVPVSLTFATTIYRFSMRKISGAGVSAIAHLSVTR